MYWAKKSLFEILIGQNDLGVTLESHILRKSLNVRNNDNSRKGIAEIPFSNLK